MSMLFKRIKDWAVSITSFRTGDVLPVDGPSGTAKIPYSDLAKEVIKDSANNTAATEAELVSGSKITIMTANGPKALPGNAITPKAYTQNVAHSIAPEFDPTKPNDAGGYAYYADEIVTNNGTTYRFKVNHPSGAWNDAEVDRYVAGESLKFFVVIDNPEYLYAITDKDGVFLFGIKKDGSVDWQKGVPSILGREGQSLIDKLFSDATGSDGNEELFWRLTDVSNLLLESIGYNGCHKFYVPPKFENGVEWNEKTLTGLEKSLREYGLSFGQGDWSDAASLQLPMPQMAIVDFSGIDAFPTTKTADMAGVVRFWDLNGNFFKKKVILNAQGDSSLSFPKKNIAVDLVNEDESAFSLKLGKWVAQDSFHIKAYYTEFFRGIAVVGYSLYKEIVDTRSPLKNRTWKIAKIKNTDYSYGPGAGFGEPVIYDKRIDDGALCFPEGFPCLVFLNSEFYGVFAFQLKKHRDNYSMDKSNPLNIHLDGTINVQTLFNGTIDWTAFEIRNPKNLYCQDGTKYDGDNPSEIVDSETAESWISSGSLPGGTAVTSKIAGYLRTSAAVRSKIEELASVYSQIVSEQDLSAKKAIVEKYFDVDSMIDYIVFGDFVGNGDGFAKNWQITSWDGEKWFLNPYDLDCIAGGNASGDVFNLPKTEHLGNVGGGLPTRYVFQFYEDRLKTRWAELRNCGIISVDNFVGKLTEWTQKVGLSNYVKEFEKWNNSPCNRDIEVNEDYWSLKVDESGKPIISYSLTGEYDSSTTYQAGDECQMNPTRSYPNSHGWWYVFVCKTESTGNNPCLTSGVRDSLSRVYNWMSRQIENMDSVYQYNN